VTSSPVRFSSLRLEIQPLIPAKAGIWWRWGKSVLQPG
jgi:hypothetical protein